VAQSTAQGVITVTARAEGEFRDHLRFYNDTLPKAGFAVTGGEVEREEGEVEFARAGASGQVKVAVVNCPAGVAGLVVSYAPGR